MHASDRNQDATCYVGNLDPQCSEELVWELFVQAGPVGAWAAGGRAGGWPSRKISGTQSRGFLERRVP